MPGFGSGPFGSGAFGEFDWSRQVLFKSAPEVHRESDTEGLLELYAEALGISYDQLRRKIRDFGDLRDPLLVRTQYDESLTIQLGQRLEEKGEVEQRGVSASVNASRHLVTKRGRFGAKDLGKEIEVRGSSIASNNRVVRVARVIASKIVSTDPPLLPDAGELKWVMRASVVTGNEEITYEVASGDMDQVAPGWLIGDGRTEVEVVAREQFFPESEEQAVLTDREGDDGFFSAGIFSSATMALTEADVGRRVTITGSSNPENNGKFSITEVLSATEAELEDPGVVAEDGGPLTWAILRVPKLTVRGPSVLLGVVETRGVDGVTTISTGSFTTLSGEFSAADIGKVLTVRKSGSAITGNYDVVTVISSSQIEVSPDFSVSETDAYWELRSRTNLGDGTELQARSTSLIRNLARDFSIRVDLREDEEFQRRWVASVSKWIGLKGTEDGYEFLAALTGYTVTAIEPLYRVSLENYTTLFSTGSTLIVGESGVGRYGLDGSLITGTNARFSSPSAVFSLTDVGRLIHIAGSGSGNDGLVGEIETVVNATTVQFRSVDTPTVPDVNNGSLTWAIVRLYSSISPELPFLDEVNTDRMTELKTAAVFVADKFCFDATWSSTLGPGDSADGAIFVDGTDPATSVVVPIIYTVYGRGDFDVVASIGEGRWKLTDALANEFFLETTPVLAPLSVLTSVASLVFDSTALGVDTGTLSTPDAVFSVGDVGEYVRIRGGASVSEAIAFEITAFTDANTVEVQAAAGSIPVADGNNGNLVVSALFQGEPLPGAPDQIEIPAGPFSGSNLYHRIEVLTGDDLANVGMNIISNVASATTVEIDTTYTSIVSGTGADSIVVEILRWEFGIGSTTPPSTGEATLEYICTAALDCAFCRANKVRIEATTTLALEKGPERLRERIDESRPAHVEIVEAYGLTIGASLPFTVTTTTP